MYRILFLVIEIKVNKQSLYTSYEKSIWSFINKNMADYNFLNNRLWEAITSKFQIKNPYFCKMDFVFVVDFILLGHSNLINKKVFFAVVHTVVHLKLKVLKNLQRVFLLHFRDWNSLNNEK